MITLLLVIVVAVVVAATVGFVLFKIMEDDNGH